MEWIAAAAAYLGVGLIFSSLRPSPEMPPVTWDEMAAVALLWPLYAAVELAFLIAEARQ